MPPPNTPRHCGTCRSPPAGWKLRRNRGRHVVVDNDHSLKAMGKCRRGHDNLMRFKGSMWCPQLQLSLYPQWTKDVFHHKPTWHHIVGISQYTVCPNNINNISPKRLQRVQGFGPLKPFEAQERSHLKRHSAVAPFLVRFLCTLSCLGLEGYRYRKHLFHLQRTACNPDAPSKN